MYRKLDIKQTNNIDRSRYCYSIYFKPTFQMNLDEKLEPKVLASLVILWIEKLKDWQRK